MSESPNVLSSKEKNDIPETAAKLFETYNNYLSELPSKHSERIAVVIPARRAKAYMENNLPFLNNQLSECRDEGKIDGADIFVILNRGGMEEDREFAKEYQPDGLEKVEVWERQGKFYSDNKHITETQVHQGISEKSRLIFIHQEDIEDNSGHGNALGTGFRTLVGMAKRDKEVYKYYLTTDTDNRIYSGEENGSWVGNGLLSLMNRLDESGSFALGARVEPCVTNPDGSYNRKKRVAGLVRATANLHSETKGFGWSPGGGTLAKGKEALAAHTSVADNKMEVPDVSFTVLTRELAKLKISTARDIFVVDAAPEQEKVSIKELQCLNGVIKNWAKEGGTISELVSKNDIPDSWKKLVRWLQGQSFVEKFFGDKLLKDIAQPKIIQILQGNIKSVFNKYGLSKIAVLELIHLTKAIPSYFILKDAARRKSSKGQENVAW